MTALQFWQQDETPLSQPQEWQSCWLAWSAFDLTDTVQLNGQPLSVMQRQCAGEVRVLAQLPRLGPGQYQVSANGFSQRFEVAPSKLNREELQQLLQDLSLQLPASLSQQLQRLGAFVGIDWQAPQHNSVEAELHRLQRAILGDDRCVGLAQLIPQLAAAPHQQWRTHYQLQPIVKTRRITAASLQQPARLFPITAEKLPQQLWQAHSVASWQTPENQVLKLFWHQVQQRLRELLPMVSTSLQDRLKQLQQQLDNLARQVPWLAQVPPPTQPPALTQVLLKQPAYRALFDSYLQWQRDAVVTLQDTALQQPLSQLPYLYQLWGSLQVIQQVLNLAEHYDYQVQQQHLCHYQAGSWRLQCLPTAVPVLRLQQPEHGVQVQLWLEHQYGQQSRAFRSISHAQRPDLVLEVTPADGLPRLYVLDPKYRLNSGQDRPEKSDIDRMHAYRDAIRYQQQHVVHYAAILYLGRFYSYGAAEVEALPARPSQIDALHNALNTVLKQALKPNN